VKQKIGDDIWPVEVPYNGPPANHIACAFDFPDRADHLSEPRSDSSGYPLGKY